MLINRFPRDYTQASPYEDPSYLATIYGPTSSITWKKVVLVTQNILKHALELLDPIKCDKAMLAGCIIMATPLLPLLISLTLSERLVHPLPIKNCDTVLPAWLVTSLKLSTFIGIAVFLAGCCGHTLRFIFDYLYEKTDRMVSGYMHNAQPYGEFLVQKIRTQLQNGQTDEALNLLCRLHAYSNLSQNNISTHTLEGLHADLAAQYAHIGQFSKAFDLIPYTKRKELLRLIITECENQEQAVKRCLPVTSLQELISEYLIDISHTWQPKPLINKFLLTQDIAKSLLESWNHPNQPLSLIRARLSYDRYTKETLKADVFFSCPPFFDWEPDEALLDAMTVESSSTVRALRICQLIQRMRNERGEKNAREHKEAAPEGEAGAAGPRAQRIHNGFTARLAERFSYYRGRLAGVAKRAFSAMRF